MIADRSAEEKWSIRPQKEYRWLGSQDWMSNSCCHAFKLSVTAINVLSLMRPMNYLARTFLISWAPTYTTSTWHGSNAKLAELGYLSEDDSSGIEASQWLVISTSRVMRKESVQLLFVNRHWAILLMTRVMIWLEFNVLVTHLESERDA